MISKIFLSGVFAVKCTRDWFIVVFITAISGSLHTMANDSVGESMKHCIDKSLRLCSYPESTVLYSPSKL